MSPRGISMEERNDEWGEGCHIDGGSCIGCGDCDNAGSFADDSDTLCPQCKGTGIFWDLPCGECDGMGRLD